MSQLVQQAIEVFDLAIVPVSSKINAWYHKLMSLKQKPLNCSWNNWCEMDGFDWHLRVYLIWAQLGKILHWPVTSVAEQ